MNQYTDRSRERTLLWLAIFGLGLASSALYVLAFAEAYRVGLPTYEFLRIGLRFIINLLWGGAFALLLLYAPNRIRVVVLLAFAGVVCSFFILSFYHFVTYGEPIGLSSIMAIGDSNLAEATEFLEGTMTAQHAAIAIGGGAIVASLTFLSFRCYPTDLYYYRWSRWNVLMAIVFIALVGKLGASDPIFSSNSIFLFVADSWFKVRSAHAELKHIDRNAIQRVGVKYSGGTVTHIIIMGESITSRHMSLYGYERDTTPAVAAQHIGFQQFVVSDACSSAPGTAPALQSIFTGGDRGETVAWHLPSLISMAAEGGIRSIWISNQSLVDDSNTMSSAWGLLSDERKYLTERGWKNTQSFDEKLLPELERELSNSSGPRLIVLHMIGAHPYYVNRYPSRFAIWGDDAAPPPWVRRQHEESFRRNKYNQYDNAVRYSDHIVGEVLHMAEKHSVASVTFLSDHGQNLGELSDHWAHSASNGPRQGFQVPVVFWINSSFVAARRLNVQVLRDNISRPFETDDLLYTWLDLFGLENSLPAMNRSLFAPARISHDRKCDKMAY